MYVLHRSLGSYLAAVISCGWVTSTIVTSVLTAGHISPGLLDLSELKDVGESMSEISLDVLLAPAPRILFWGSDFHMYEWHLLSSRQSWQLGIFRPSGLLDLGELKDVGESISEIGESPSRKFLPSSFLNTEFQWYGGRVISHWWRKSTISSAVLTATLMSGTGLAGFAQSASWKFAESEISSALILADGPHSMLCCA